MKVILSNRNIVFLSLIVMVAISLSIVSYQYSAFTSERIQTIAVRDIRSNAEIQAHDLSNSLSNKLSDISSNLQIIAQTPAVQDNDFQGGRIVLNAAESATGEIVDFYMWLDKDGRIIWISNTNQTTYEQYKGLDLSYRSYFIAPKDTGKSYYSSVTESNDGIPRLYISYPILGAQQENAGGIISASNIVTANEFKGIVAAGLRTDVLGRLLEQELSPKLQSQVVLLDHRGIILYSEEPSFVGKNVFGVRFQSFLSSISPETMNSMNAGLEDALNGNAGSMQIPMESQKSTLAYEPVSVDGQEFGVLYVLAPHEQAADVAALIEQQKNLSTFIILLIGAVATGIAVIILSWNKRLEETVNARTADLKRANEQLEAHDKVKSEFINIAAHELRTPVLPILLSAESLADKVPYDDNVQIILRNAERLTKLTNDILDVSRIESGAFHINMQRLNLRDVISSIVQDYRKQITDSDVKLVYELADIYVSGDKGRITQVITNLLNNSLAFTEKGQVTIKTEKKNDEAIVTVQDTGTGIDPEIMPRLFTKFTTKSDRGTGLGLFISKSIIEAHGGRIWAENNKDGRGATFSFAIPVHRM